MTEFDVKPDLPRVYDPEERNAERADWAREAMDAFQRRTGTDDCDALADLLTDLMHLCDRRTRTRNGKGPEKKNPPPGWDFNEALRRAVSHYTAETDKNGG